MHYLDGFTHGYIYSDKVRHSDFVEAQHAQFLPQLETFESDRDELLKDLKRTRQRDDKTPDEDTEVVLTPGQEEDNDGEEEEEGRAGSEIMESELPASETMESELPECETMESELPASEITESHVRRLCGHSLDESESSSEELEDRRTKWKRLIE